jgi:hypothetical protein
VWILDSFLRIVAFGDSQDDFGVGAKDMECVIIVKEKSSIPEHLYHILSVCALCLRYTCRHDASSAGIDLISCSGKPALPCML